MPIQGGKTYYDGEFWVTIPPTTNPHKRRKKAEEDVITVVTPVEEESPSDDVEAVEEKEEIQGEEGAEMGDSSPTSSCENKVIERVLTKKEYFEELYKKYWNRKTRDKKKRIISELRPYFDSYNKTRDYVEGQLYRKRRNYAVRKTRTDRKMQLQNYQHKFNYFVTFTYDGKKHTEDSFREKLSTCLRLLSGRKKWKYVGIWEYGERGSERLHFHAIMYIPEGTMPGMMIEMKKYSTKRKQWEITTENTYFNDSFGSTIFEEINPVTLRENTEYLLKYIEKTGERLVYSRGLPQYILNDVLDDDILCEHDPDTGKQILYPNFRCIVDGEILGRVSPELIEQMPKSN